MNIKEGREYRALQDFSLVPREEGSEEYRVKGTAVVFDTPTVIAEYDGIKYCEVIDRHAFDECDLSDVIMNYNHAGKVVARLRNKTLALDINERGVDIGQISAERPPGGNCTRKSTAAMWIKCPFRSPCGSRSTTAQRTRGRLQRSRNCTTFRRWIFPPITRPRLRRGAFSRWSTRKSLRLWSKPGGVRG